MAEILPIRRKPLSNQSINRSINQSINQSICHFTAKERIELKSLIEASFSSPIHTQIFGSMKNMRKMNALPLNDQYGHALARKPLHQS